MLAYSFTCLCVLGNVRTQADVEMGAGSGGEFMTSGEGGARMGGGGGLALGPDDDYMDDDMPYMDYGGGMGHGGEQMQAFRMLAPGGSGGPSGGGPSSRLASRPKSRRR